MGQLDHLDDIAFTTALEIDKLFPEIYTGSFTATTGVPTQMTRATIAQPHGANVLPVGIMSLDGTNWQEAGTYHYSGSTLTLVADAGCYTTSTNLVIMCINHTGGNLTCYYKVVLISDD